MASDGYVLLYECDEGDYGYESVSLRFLPFNHPFGALLLHKGSRQAAERQYYEQDIWRLQVISYQPWTPPDMEAYLKGPGPGEKLQSGIHYQGLSFIDKKGWRRKHVSWLSAYGAPSELHLLLYDSIRVWVAQQQALNPLLCIFDSPKTLVGALRLDSDVISSEDITRDISDHTPTLYVTRPVRRVTDGASPTDSGNAPGCGDMEHSYQEVASYTCTSENAHTGRLAAEEPDGVPTAICGATAPAMTTADHPDQDEQGVECNPACQSSEGHAEWMNSHQYLKDIVLSCTHDEVRKTLAAFYDVQARNQFMKYKDELLQCLASRTIALGE